jgi:hypothetical protein
MTRQEYLDASREDGPQAHRTYYAQMVTPYMVDTVARIIGADRLRNSTDPHFNDIPMTLWDAITPKPVPHELANKFKALGDYATAAGLVCVVKEAARQFVERAR